MIRHFLHLLQTLEPYTVAPTGLLILEDPPGGQSVVLPEKLSPLLSRTTARARNVGRIPCRFETKVECIS